MSKTEIPASAAAPVAAAPPAAGLRKVSLAGFAVQTPAGKSAKSYPLLPDPDGQVAEFQELFGRHGASSALAAKAPVKPAKEFHTARHTLFVPISASVKTKLGRGDDE